jgi:sporulation protein YlmC with PRC-barrel domain
MKGLLFALLAGAVLTSGPSLAQTAPAQSPSPAAKQSAPPSDPAGNGAKPAATAVTPSPAPTREMTVASLTDKDLIGQNGGDLGDIEQVVENTAEKKPYVVVSRGGMLGFFETEYLVPVDQIAVSGDRIVAKNMTQAQLEDSKRFDDTAGTYRTLENTQKVAVPEQR